MVCHTFEDQDERASGTLMGGEDECRHADAGLAAEKGADRRGERNGPPRQPPQLPALKGESAAGLQRQRQNIGNNPQT